MRLIIAKIFRLLFRIKYFKSKHFGIHQKIFAPLNLFNGITQTIKYKDLNLTLNIDDWIQENIYFLGEYESIELKTLKLFLKKDSVFIDIGANFGLYTLNASNLINETGQIIAFEPFSKSFSSLKNNLLINKLNKVTIENIAIGECDGTINLFYNKEDRNLGMVSTTPLNKGFIENVSITSFDNYLKNTSNIINSIDLIKIDVEGSELSVLKGMKKSLIKFSPSILIEILDINGKENMNAIESFLNKFGYEKFYINNEGFVSKKETNSNRFNYIFSKKTISDINN